MLSDQRSPYVGRFARGWHRLPGDVPPGNHRPRREPHASISARSRPELSPRGGRERPRGREQAHPRRARVEERAGARGGRRSRREHVVHEQNDRRRLARALERPRHGGTPHRPRASRLGPRVGRPDEQPRHRQVQSRSDHLGQRPRLVEPALGEPARGERNHVTASTGESGPAAGLAAWVPEVSAGPHGPATAAMEAPSASATPRHPPNFRWWIAFLAGPSNRNGARARSISGGGHARQRVRGAGAGAPHRSHHGRSSARSELRQASQNGHGPSPQPAHRRGKTTSSSARSIDAR